MLSEKDKRILKQFSNAIRQKFPEARIWAFGSRTRGLAMAESDLDVCVVIERLDDDADRQIMEAAWEVGFENDMIISTVSYSAKEFDQGPCSESMLVENILNEGVAS